jgi:hypothetical protein
VRTALASTLAHLDTSMVVATTARDYGHPDGPAGPVWAPLAREPDAVRRVRLPDLSGTPATVDTATSPAVTAQQEATVAPGAVALPTTWLDDDESSDFVDVDPGPHETESWPA